MRCGLPVIFVNVPILESFVIEHVYRDFNSDADSTANETLEIFRAHLHPNGNVISESWTQPQFSARLNTLAGN